MRKNILKNMYTALITPFKNDFSLDEEALISLLKKQNDSKIEGIVILSTTGEGATLTTSEAHRIITLAKEHFTKDIIIGIAENDPKKVLEKMNDYNQYEPNAYLVCAPFYNKGNEKGIYEFYKTILDKTKYPLILYNVPSRCGYDIPLNVIKKLSREKMVIGIKNASYSYKYYFALARLQNERFKVLCGNDDFFFVGLNLMESGIISVATNIIPNYFVDLYENYKKDYKKFKSDYFVLDSLFTYLSLDINPIMIKELMASYTSMSSTCRYPLCSVKHYKSKKLIEDLTKNERINYECNNGW